MKIIILVAALACSAALLAACGGGGGSDTATNPPTNNNPQSLTDAQIAADKALANQMLKDYMTASSAAAHEAFAETERQIRFDMVRRGLICGSDHRDTMMDAIEYYADANLTGAVQYAGTVGGEHYIDEAAFKQLFARLKSDEIAHYQSFPFTNCPDIDWRTNSATVINSVYTNPYILWLNP